MQRTWEGAACSDLTQGCAQEWILPNGVGGYASQSLLGVSTRAEHSLLMASTPDGQRYSLLARLEDSFDKKALATHQYPNAFWPAAYSSLRYISLDPSPVWVFDLGAHLIARRVEVAQGRNATRVSYHLLAGEPATLQIKPLFAFRAQSQLRHKQDGLEYSFAYLRGMLTVLPEDAPLPCVLHLGEAEFHAAPDWFFRFLYEREQEANRPHEEDLFTPGVISVELSQERPFSFWAVADLAPQPTTAEATAPPTTVKALEAPRFFGPLLIARQIARRRSLVQLREHLQASAQAFFWVDPEKRAKLFDSFYAPSLWAGAALLALPGLCAATGRVAEGLSLIEQHVQSASGELTQPEAVESLLIAAWAASLLTPTQEVPSVGPLLRERLSRLLSGSALIPLYEQASDAPLGSAGLWHWALTWSAWQDEPGARREAFLARADAVFAAREQYANTPEAASLWAFATPRPLFTGVEARPRLDALRRELVTARGLRARVGDDSSSPQWLGLYTSAYLSAYGDNNAAAREHLEQCLLSLLPHLESERCIGFLSEIFEASAPYAPRGAVASAPNVAEVLRALSLLGIHE